MHTLHAVTLLDEKHAVKRSHALYVVGNMQLEQIPNPQIGAVTFWLHFGGRRG